MIVQHLYFLNILLQILNSGVASIIVIPQPQHILTLLWLRYKQSMAFHTPPHLKLDKRLNIRALELKVVVLETQIWLLMKLVVEDFCHVAKTIT